MASSRRPSGAGRRRDRAERLAARQSRRPRPVDRDRSRTGRKRFLWPRPAAADHAPTLRRRTRPSFRDVARRRSKSTESRLCSMLS
jgi:hypothetical protein